MHKFHFFLKMQLVKAFCIFESLHYCLLKGTVEVEIKLSFPFYYKYGFSSDTFFSKALKLSLFITLLSSTVI